jgi:hypothetical protein
VKAKAVSEYFVTESLKTMAMIRGVCWLLASWTASSRAEETKTTRVNTDEARVLSKARAESGWTHVSQCKLWSIAIKS